MRRADLVIPKGPITQGTKLARTLPTPRLPQSAAYSTEPNKSKCRRFVNRRVRDMGSYVPDYIRFVREPEDLVPHLLERIEVTLGKHLNARVLAEMFGFDPDSIEFTGAKVQDQRGNSSFIQLDGRSVLTGDEAGHVGIGTFSRRGRALSDQLMQTVKGARVNAEQAPTLYKVICCGVGYDASTVAMPAYLNRLCAVTFENPFIADIENMNRRKLPGARGIKSRILISEQEKMLEVLAGIGDCITRRAVKISSGEATEFLQSPSDVSNLILDGQESTLLDFLIAKMELTNGEFQSGMEFIARNIPQRVEDWLEHYDAAKEESAAIVAISAANPLFKPY